mgnify:CR=1 FL=1
MIFNAIRREHVNKIILPAIKNGSVVLCDRFIDSTIVYQGLVGEVSENDLLELHKKYCYNLYPDIKITIPLQLLMILPPSSIHLIENKEHHKLMNDINKGNCHKEMDRSGLRGKSRVRSN